MSRRVHLPADRPAHDQVHLLLYGGTTPHDVGQYSVQNLDDLVVHLVEDELAHLEGPHLSQQR